MVKEFDHDAISTKLGYFSDIHFKKITSMTDTGNIDNRFCEFLCHSVICIYLFEIFIRLVEWINITSYVLKPF